MPYWGAGLGCVALLGAGGGIFVTYYIKTFNQIRLIS